MIASLLGNDNFLDRNTAETFRDGGTFHVLVISGLHITFIGGLALWMTSFFTRRLAVRSTLAAGFLWAYTFAVGAEVPVVRASLMFSFLLVARIVYREGSLMNALGFCTLLILVWRPSDLVSPSFQLTFVSVVAIVGCSFPLIEKLRATGAWYPSADEPLPPNVPDFLRRVSEFLYWNEDAWRIESRRQIWSANLYKLPYLARLKAPNLRSVAAYVFEGLLVSLIVQVWMLPLLVIYFHRVSPSGLVLNLWVGFFLALESFAAIAAVAIGSFSTWLAAPLVGLTEISNVVMISIPEVFSNSGAAGLRLPVYAGPLRLLYPAYFATLVLSSVWLFRLDPFALEQRRSGRNIALAGFALGSILASLIIFHPYSAPSADGLLKIDFLDVGQGDSALVTFPDGQTMLVDGGGRPDFRKDDARSFDPDTSRIGERVVSEFLWEKGYSRIDYLVVTHADADHIQGLTDVARNFDVGTVFVGGTPSNNTDFEELLALARSDKVPVQILIRGTSLDISGVNVEVLHPASDTPPGGSENNASVVLRLVFGTRAFLLTGDIERETEQALVGENDLRLDAGVIKVPHHGSKTSSTQAFVNEVGAGTAVISVGRRSRFGHPHEEVLTRWRNADAEVLTTGANGTITVETDGVELRVRTFRP
jgi:competence protein ComEC